MKNLVRKYLIKILFPLIEDDVRKYVEELDGKYKHNYWLIELQYAKLMKNMQKKYGTIFKETWETYISNDNPFRKELDI